MANRQELRGREEKSGDDAHHNDTTGYRLNISAAWRICRYTADSDTVLKRNAMHPAAWSNSQTE